jgi:hypothetical protein
MTVSRSEIEVELVAAEQEISSLRLIRERASYKLEQALRERERLYRRLSALEREGAPSRDPEEVA